MRFYNHTIPIVAARVRASAACSGTSATPCSRSQFYCGILDYLGWAVLNGTGLGLADSTCTKRTAARTRANAPEWELLCDCDTEPCESLSADNCLRSQTGASARMLRAAGAQTVRTIGRDTQYETGLKRLENATVDKFALDCVHSVGGTEEFQI